MRINEKTVQTLLARFYTERPIFIQKLNVGKTSKIFKAVLENDTYLVVRISPDPSSINYYLKEQWCAQKANENGVPATEILEVGNTVIPFPYMIAKEYYGIPGDRYLGDTTKMWRQIGELAAKINKIKTSGIGHVFDWSHNQITKIKSWDEYMQTSFDLNEIINFYKKNDILTKENLKKLSESAEHIRKWNFKTHLAHGALLPKNVIVNKDGDIIRVLDWKHARSANSKFLELSIILNNCTPEQGELVLEGYGLREKEFEESVQDMDALYILRNRLLVQEFIDKNNTKAVNAVQKEFNRILDKY